MVLPIEQKSPAGGGVSNTALCGVDCYLFRDERAGEKRLRQLSEPFVVHSHRGNDAAFVGLLDDLEISRDILRRVRKRLLDLDSNHLRKLFGLHRGKPKPLRQDGARRKSENKILAHAKKRRGLLQVCNRPDIPSFATFIPPHHVPSVVRGNYEDRLFRRSVDITTPSR
jgi:hypothetical protein